MLCIAISLLSSSDFAAPAVAMSGSAPSTATVLEFRCLFTHDLRRKQKRWQDGRLKYHSFNARVMVYDERGNSVGDMHWHGEYDFGEGEEVQLDRGGVIVQVEDLVERRETDLSELVDKRVQEKQQRQMLQLSRSAAPSAVLPRVLPRPLAIASDRTQPPRHQPLHHVIGTPTGHHGKALVPKESPFEQRQQTAESPGERSTKRRKYDDPPPSKSGYASALFGQTLTLSATPSSSVPAIRRPRPEASSDPPAETEAQHPREDPKPARREQLQSSRRLNQSGYAQSLFGQHLTLSHTPISSVPSRPQPQNESNSNTTVDGNSPEPPGTAGALPSSQPIESHHSGRQGSKSRSALPRGQTRTNNRLAKSSADTEDSKEHVSLPRRHHATNKAQTTPESIDIIEIDDPESIAPPPVRQPRTQKTTPASLRDREGDLEGSNAAVGESHPYQKESVRSRRQQRSEPDRQGKHKRAKSYERTSQPQTAVSKADESNAGSGLMGLASHEHVARAPAPAVARDLALPVTELRIKSSKKRGLLMISETSKVKKTHRKVPADSARPFEEISRHYPRDTDHDDPFHQSPSSRLPSKSGHGRDAGESAKSTNVVSKHISSNGDDEDDYLDYPVLNRDGEWEKKEAVCKLGTNSALRTISTELGEDDDPFQSPSLAFSEQTYTGPQSAKRNKDLQLGHERFERVEVTVRNASDAGLFCGEKGRREPADVAQPLRRASPSLKAGYDPSSPQAFSTGTPSSAQRNRREHDVGVDRVEILRPVDNNANLSKAKRQRHSRRKVITDDDEHNVDPPASLPRNADIGSDSESGATCVLGEWAANKEPKSRKSLKTSAQQDTAMSESGDESLRSAARKTKIQQREFGVESEEDELPIIRRESRRQRRSRARSSEEPSPLPSEQDGSEEEDFPRKRRKTKAPKPSEDRPRLEKIKKNVKSRELVGFNLAALNAPLGLRGIGMPFSILPSPVTEPTQRRLSNRAVVDEIQNPPVVDKCDAQMLPSSPNPPAASLKMNAQAQQKSLSITSKREEANHIPLNSSDSHVHRSKFTGENVANVPAEPNGVASPKVPEVRDSSKSDGPEASSQSPTRTEKKQTPGHAPSLKHARTSHQPVPSRPGLEAQQYHAAIEQTLSSLDQPVRNSSPLPLSRQSSTVAKQMTSDKAIPEDFAKPVKNVQLPPAPAQATTSEPTTNSGPLLRGQSHANGQKPSDTVQATGAVTSAPSKEPVAAVRPPNITVKSQAAPSLNQQKPNIQRQPSILESAQASKTVEGDPNVSANTSLAPSAGVKPDSPLIRRSLPTVDQDTATIETTVGNAGSDRTCDLIVRQPKAIGLRRQASAPRRINNIGTKSTPKVDSTEASSTEVPGKPASNVRLANPASRGRKAALASHAAGPVPQRILPPTQPAMVVPISTADLAMTPFEQAPKEPERPKKKMTFPGFQSARSDGPWSREAFDLLESGRPE